MSQTCAARGEGLVAAALSVLAAVMIGGKLGLVIGLLTAACLAVGAAPSAIPGLQTMPGSVTIRTMTLNPVELVGHALAVVMALLGAASPRASEATSAEPSEPRMMERNGKVRG